MKQVSEMPTSRQFVAVWQNPTGGVWSDTFKISNGEMSQYSNEFDDFFPPDIDTVNSIKENNAQYFIAD